MHPLKINTGTWKDFPDFETNAPQSTNAGQCGSITLQRVKDILIYLYILKIVSPGIVAI